ncbi:FAD-dependent oxidoreductase [Nonomuraea thailandensis]
MGENARVRPAVVVLGGGYGGSKVARLLDDVADVTLVDPSDAFMHNVAAWRALVEPEWLDRIFVPYRRLLTHGRFLRDRAVAVDGTQVTLASGATLRPDYLVLATGSAYPFPAKAGKPDAELAKAEARAAHEALAGAERVLLVGAGPVGLELAGEIKAAFPGKHVTLADVAPDILPGPFEQELRDELRRQLDELGVELKLGSPLRELPGAPPATAAPIAIATEAGDKLTADVWFRCFGVVPAPTTCAASSPGPWTRRDTSASTRRCGCSGRSASSPSATSPTPTATWPASPGSRASCWPRTCARGSPARARRSRTSAAPR